MKINIISLIHRVTDQRATLTKRPARTVKTPLITLTTPRRIVRIPSKTKKAPSWIIPKGCLVTGPTVTIIYLSEAGSYRFEYK